MQRRFLLFVVISVLVVTFVSGSFIPFFIVFAEPSGPITCERTGTLTETCCQEHIINRSPDNPAGTLVKYCTDCTIGPGGGFSSFHDYSERYIDIAAEQPPTPQPFDPTAPLQGGVLEEQQTPPTFVPGTSPGVLEQLEQSEGFSPGFLERQQEQPSLDQEATELPPPATEGTQPATVEEEQPVPVCQEGLEFNEDLGFCVPEDCPEGQVLDEESGICVLDEPETAEVEPAEEEPAQSDPEGEQPSEESDSGEGSNN